MTDVALFPIPGAVSFPGVPRALHVFEPRYRQMVEYCIDEQKATLSGDCWQTMSAEEFSFALTGMIGMPAEIAQALLEQTDPQQRLNDILEMINGIRR